MTRTPPRCRVTRRTPEARWQFFRALARTACVMVAAERAGASVQSLPRVHQVNVPGCPFFVSVSADSVMR